jgi:hypothetical protein
MLLPLCKIHSNTPQKTVTIIYMFASQPNKLIFVIEIGLDILQLVKVKLSLYRAWRPFGL